MREIKFRGKSKKGEWVYGDFIHSRVTTDVWISSRNATCGAIEFIQPRSVIPETVGQFVGIQDRRGADIYEGDILQLFCPWFDQSKKVVGVVFFNKAEWLIKGRGFTRDLSGIEVDDGCWGGSIKIEYQVIGNIHDNPELAEGIEL